MGWNRVPRAVSAADARASLRKQDVCRRRVHKGREVDGGNAVQQWVSGRTPTASTFKTADGMALLQHLLAQEFKPPPTNHPDPRQGVPRGGATLQVCRKSWATLWREERSRESRSELTTQKPRCDHFPDKCNVYIAALWSTKACGNTPGQLSSEMVHVLLKFSLHN
ncbi:hypothetical protein C0Q70_18789 [Pomacea canaliculata]|uniref:Uncharacterized protein n=1 Tax=Pomacea canaliculata TaxID=400727 RepID=A0A2T7NHH8_POMCA|nr:hypothetical protein C0Q70_18789 [Pomacea canaliculata]